MARHCERPCTRLQLILSQEAVKQEHTHPDPCRIHSALMLGGGPSPLILRGSGLQYLNTENVELLCLSFLRQPPPLQTHDIQQTHREGGGGLRTT